MKYKKALGIIETFGLVSAIEAADTAVKAANVELIGYELARGGLTTIKVVGDVGGVKAAMSAAKAAASKVGKVVSTHVIPRPHDDVEIFMEQEHNNVCNKKVHVKAEEVVRSQETEVEKDEVIDEDSSMEQKYTCNLCADPLCPRKKGDPRVNCIHHSEKDS